MSDSYLGEIRMFAGNFAPLGWALCDGQLLDISGNEALYALLGTTYGGDGISNFALPDLRGRLPIHMTGNYSLGSKGGSETVTLKGDELPVHTHNPVTMQNTNTTDSPANAQWSASAPFYSNGKDAGGNKITPVSMNGQVLLSMGGGQAHENMMPSLTVSFIIALQGAFPPRP